jgi:hypothetical protein
MRCLKSSVEVKLPRKSCAMYQDTKDTKLPFETKVGFNATRVTYPFNQ